MTWSVSAVGLLIEYVVWTIGIGAACATLLAALERSGGCGGRAADVAVPAPGRDSGRGIPAGGVLRPVCR